MNFSIEQFYKLFQGALVFQCIFLLFLYTTARKKDIFFYCIYLLLLAIYFFWNAPNTFFNLNDEEIFDSPFYLYANTPLVIITHLAYIYFLKHFFTGYFQSTRLNKYVRLFTLLAPVFIIISVISIYTLRSNQYIFYLVNFFSTGISIYILTYIYKRKVNGVRLVSIGMTLNVIGNTLTVLMIVLWKANIHNLLTDNYPLFFMRLGILADIFLYMIAILQKLSLHEKQLVTQKLESQLAVEKVRTNISKELHDDIGATLSGINMYSHLAKQQATEGKNAATYKTLDLIQQASVEMIYRLKDMVWTMQSDNDSVKQFTGKLKEYGSFITGAKHILLHTNFSDEGESLNLSTEIKHHLYVIAKETLNNAVKYSNARLITINTSFHNKLFTMDIIDDGIGFEKQQVAEGNGLLNIQTRADEIGALLQLITTPGNGTKWKIQLKIT